MQIDQQQIHLALAFGMGLLLAFIILWFYFRQQKAQAIELLASQLKVQNDSQQQLLQLDIENLENELDLLRDQLQDRERLLVKKIDELNQLHELKGIYATLAAQINDYRDELKKSAQQYQDLQAQYQQCRQDLSETRIKAEEQIKASRLVIENLEHSKEQLTQQFEHLGNKIFNENSQTLKQASQQELTQLLMPFKEQFSEFKRKVEQIHELDSRDRVSLSEQVKQLSSLNQKVSEDTENLTRALQGDVKFQGNWGEMILENLLENSGLRKDFEYHIQPSYRDENNKLFRPDVVIELPDQKSVIIDSKVSLKAYTQYAAAVEDNDRQEALKQHVASLKNHIRLLSEKDYASLEGLQSQDFVILFVPVEQALMLAINEEPEMIFEAFKKKIILVSATTLLATVRTIENFWRYDRQQSNAEEIARRAGDMLDKFSLFVEELENIGVCLDKAKSSYTTAHNRLVSGNGNLVSRARGIQELGIKGKKVID